VEIRSLIKKDFFISDLIFSRASFTVGDILFSTGTDDFLQIRSRLDGFGLRAELHLDLFPFAILEPICTVIGACKDIIGVCRYRSDEHRSMQGDSSAGPS